MPLRLLPLLVASLAGGRIYHTLWNVRPPSPYTGPSDGFNGACMQASTRLMQGPFRLPLLDVDARSDASICTSQSS